MDALTPRDSRTFQLNTTHYYKHKLNKLCNISETGGNRCNIPK